MGDVHVSSGACGGQKRVPASLRLEVQVVMSCQLWVLETDLKAVLLAPSVQPSSWDFLRGSLFLREKCFL